MAKFSILIWAFDLNLSVTSHSTRLRLRLDRVQISVFNWTIFSPPTYELNSRHNAKQYHNWRRNTYRLHISTYMHQSVRISHPYHSESCNAMFSTQYHYSFLWAFLLWPVFFFHAVVVQRNIVSFPFRYDFDCKHMDLIAVWSHLSLLLVYYYCFIFIYSFYFSLTKYFETANSIWTLALFSHHGQFSTELKWTCVFVCSVKANEMEWGKNAFFFLEDVSKMAERVLCSAYISARINRSFIWDLGQYSIETHWNLNFFSSDFAILNAN